MNALSNLQQKAYQQFQVLQHQQESGVPMDSALAADFVQIVNFLGPSAFAPASAQLPALSAGSLPSQFGLPARLPSETDSDAPSLSPHMDAPQPMLDLPPAAVVQQQGAGEQTP